MSEVVWLPEAVEDMGRLRLFLEDKSTSAAVRMAKTVLDGVTLLRDFSERGKPLNDGTSRRELYLPLYQGPMFCVTGSTERLSSLSASGIAAKIEAQSAGTNKSGSE